MCEPCYLCVPKEVKNQIKNMNFNNFNNHTYICTLMTESVWECLMTNPTAFKTTE